MLAGLDSTRSAFSYLSCTSLAGRSDSETLAAVSLPSDDPYIQVEGIERPPSAGLRAEPGGRRWRRLAGGHRPLRFFVKRKTNRGMRVSAVVLRMLPDTPGVSVVRLGNASAFIKRY